MTDTIEMWWRCKACGCLNGGLSKKCGERPVVGGRVVGPKSDLGCGKGQEDEEWIFPDDISSRAAITDKDHLRQANEGPDWVCSYCGSTQRRGDGRCSVCGGDPDFNASERNDDLRVTEHGGSREIEKRDVPWKRERASGASTSSPTLRAPTPSRAPTLRVPDVPLKRRTSAPFVVGGLVIAVAALLLFIFWPRYVDAQVTAMQWTSTINVERYQKVADEGWDSPGDAVDVVNLGKRVRDRKKVADGTEPKSVTDASKCGQTCTTVKGKCYTTPRKCTSKKNGTASCTGGGRKCDADKQSCKAKTCTIQVPKYKWVDIKDDWYRWNVWRWRHNRSITRTGKDLDPLPPDRKRLRLNVGCASGEKERATGVLWSYSTTFTDEKGKTYSYATQRVEKFQSLPIGTEKRLRLVGGVVTIIEE